MSVATSQVVFLFSFLSYLINYLFLNAVLVPL